MNTLQSSREIIALNESFQRVSENAVAPQGFLARVRSFVLRKIAGRELAEMKQLNKLTIDAINQLSSSKDLATYVASDSRAREIEALGAHQDSMRGEMELRLREEIARLEATVSSHASQLAVLDSVTKGMESILLSLPSKTATSASSMKDAEEAISDFRYVLLENRFRGSEAEIMQRQADYPELFTAVSDKPVLDIGCGRGELLELFKQQGVKAYGMDLDAGMIEVASAKKLEVRLGDAIQHLKELEDSSLAGVIAIQVVEHLPLEVLRSLLSLSRRKVAKGGTVVFETINTKSLLALGHNYFRDPTHIWPLHPDTMRYEMELAGFSNVSVQERSPYPQEVLFPKLVEQDEMLPRYRHLNDNFNLLSDKLNELFFGHQDYAIKATVA